MNNRIVKIPGPDHPIAIKRNSKRVIVKFAGEIIADTTRAFTLQEANYPAAFYIPRQDARMDLLQRSALQTYCPYKGEASYFSIMAGDNHSIDAVWTYEAPYEAVGEIKDFLAFYPARVESISEEP